MKKKLFLACLILPLVVVGSFAWRARPVMRGGETYNAFFPKEKFLDKIHAPVSEWMVAQLKSDFREISPVTAEKTGRAYATILERIKNPEYCCHYRILDNKLYRYSSQKYHCESRDTPTEKALKTLLCHANVPDLDFLIVPMDGVPETHLPSDFYLMEDQVPILAQAKLREPLTRFVVLIPDQISLSDSWFNISKEVLAVNDKVPWSQKIAKAFWRGGTADIDVNERSVKTLRLTPRLKLCRLSKEQPQWIDALFYTADSQLLYKLLREEGLLSSFVSKEEHLHYRYQPALDGHMCTYPGLHWRLISDSLTLKQDSDQVQWFYSALKPYEHYLPIQREMDDLVAKIQWAEEHPAECVKMIERAREFVARDLMYEDCYRYLYLALQEYAAHQNIDFQKLKRETGKDPHWVCIHYRKRAEFFKWLNRKIAKVA